MTMSTLNAKVPITHHRPSGTADRMRRTASRASRCGSSPRREREPMTSTTRYVIEPSRKAPATPTMSGRSSSTVTPTAAAATR